jgi:hypothetical protein
MINIHHHFATYNKSTALNIITTTPTTSLHQQVNK